MSVISSTSGTVTSRPPSPQIKPSTGGPCGGVAVHRRTNFGSHHATEVWRTEREIAINHSNGAEALEAFRYFLARKWPEPEDAEVVLLGMGTMSTSANVALRKLREQGKKVGFVRLRWN